MNTRCSTIILSVLALCPGIASGQAQSNEDSNAIQVRTVPVELRDAADRPFETSRLTVALTVAPGYQNGQSVSKGTAEFGVGDSVGKSYPVEDGRASVVLLAPSDPQSQPFQYDFSANGADGKVYVTDSPVEVTSEMPRAIHLRSRLLAPVSHSEIYGSVLFAIAAVALILLTFFFLAFRRMLFNRRMEVGSAVVWSGILTLVYLVLASCTVLIAHLNPSLLTQQAVNTYIGLVVTFIGLYFFGLVVMLLLTRPRAVRS
jgi:hypothetical protein